MLSGMISRKETDNITPAEKDSILQTNISLGLRITPMRDPANGPRTEIIITMTIWFKKSLPFSQYLSFEYQLYIIP